MLLVRPGWQSLVQRQFRRVRTDLVSALDGLDDSCLGIQAPGVANPIGWTVWHLTRGIDRNISEIAGRQQVWLTSGWAERFGRLPDPCDTGFGHSSHEVATFSCPSGADLLAYHAAVAVVVEQYLAGASDTDLERRTTSPTLSNTHTVEERLAALLHDSFSHLGQVSVTRALVISGTKTA